MRVLWPDKISNAGLQCASTGQEAIGIILQQRRWRWLGPVLRMETTAHARTVLT